MKIMKYCGRICCSIALLVCMTSCDNAQSVIVQKQEKIKENEMITLDSGLRYEILKEAPADAQKPEAGNVVTVHYTGWLNEGGDEAGVKFDSSVDRGEKFSFPLGMGYVIRGWDEGVLQMAIGQKIRLYVPSELGYGSRGAGAIIPAHADLIFDVELFEIQ